MIIGLHGLKNAGKDTAASYLVKHKGFVQFALGDEIYKQVSKAFGVSEADLRSREWKHTVRAELALRNCNDREFVRMIVASEMPAIDGQVSAFCTEAQTCPRTGTFIVQRWATEYRRRTFGNSYWVDLVAAKLITLPAGTKVVISDIREDHEVEVLEWFTRTHGPMKCGVVEIIRPTDTLDTGHSSDNALSRQFIDGIINNRTGDIDGLYQQLEEFIQRKMIWLPAPNQK